MAQQGVALGKTVRLGGRTYRVEGRIVEGGTSEVYRVFWEDEPFALKVYVPPALWNVMPGNTEAAWLAASELAKLQTEEHHFLGALRHPHIVRVRDRGLLDFGGRGKASSKSAPQASVPVIVTEYIDGLPLDKALNQFPLAADDVARLLHQAALALDYVHETHNYMHTDVRAGNVLVRRDTHDAVLIDFAFCKNLNFNEVAPDGRTRLLSDPALLPQNVPPLQRALEGALTREELRDELFPTLDYYQFGLMLRQLEPAFGDLFEHREQEYLRLISAKLTNWPTAKLMAAEPLAPRIARLAAGNFYPFGVQELAFASAGQRTVSLPLDIRLPLTGLAQSVVDNRSFRRLATIRQLSFLHMVYPAATHTRFLHSLHVYETTRQLVTHLFGTPLFRLTFGETDARALLVTALLHDINHFPFLHIFQEAALPSLSNRALVDAFASGDMTRENSLGDASLYQLLETVGVDPDRYERLVFKESVDQVGPVDEAINSIVSSGADVDKLAYLAMDSLLTGVRYGGGLDVGTLLKSAVLVETPSGRLHLAYEERALQAVENVFMTRLWNFRSIYWHHTNRAIMSMVLHVVRRLYLERGLNPIDFIAATQHAGDDEALRWLDQSYESQFGVPSVCRSLLDRRAVYRRLYTVRPELPDERDGRLWEKIKRLLGPEAGPDAYPAEQALRREVARRVSERYAATVGEDDILIDLPRRKIDHGGDAYVLRRGAPLRLVEVSEPVKTLSDNYDRLAKRVRVFISPRISGFSKVTRETDRSELRNLLLDSVSEVEKSIRLRLGPS